MESKLIQAPEYVAFDLETTGFSPVDDEILEIGAVAIKNGEVVGEFQTFAKPKRHDEWEEAETITGITPGMVADAPSQQDAVASFIEFAAGRCLVGHNAAGFDTLFLKSVLGEDPSCDLVDTLRIARLTNPGMSHKLEPMFAFAVKEGARPLCEAGTAHRAVYDSYMVATLYEFLKPRMVSIRQNVDNKARHHRGRPYVPSAETIAVSDVFDDLRTILDTQNSFDKQWALKLIDGIEKCEPAGKTGMFDNLESVLHDFIEDRDGDSTSVMEQVEALFDPVIRTTGKVPVEFDGKSFALTGDFEIGDRRDIITPIIVSNGGSVKSSVSGKVDYLVVGNLGSSDWAFGNYGTKVTKALDLKAAGKNIEIIGEEVLLAAALGFGNRKETDVFDLTEDGSTDGEKKFRKRIGLPVRKKILYRRWDDTLIAVSRIEILDHGDTTGLFSLNVTTTDGSVHRICSEYLAEMQKN